MTTEIKANFDSETVRDFGEEWRRFDQEALSSDELEDQFGDFFRCFPVASLGSRAVGFDLGCGSGRWVKCLAPKVGGIHCIDASATALETARKNLSEYANCQFHLASVESIPLTEGSMDFGYSIGVLHHVPNTAMGLKSCVKLLKPGGPFAVYLYYAFDNRRVWYRLLWRTSDVFRRIICRLPSGLKYLVSQTMAAAVYFPLARTAQLGERCGACVEGWPLAWYRHRSFYTMRTDALDRFGTRLEQRFTAAEIEKMMEDAGLENIVFSDKAPYWCAVGYKRL